MLCGYKSIFNIKIICYQAELYNMRNVYNIYHFIPSVIKVSTIDSTIQHYAKVYMSIPHVFD